MAAMIPGPIVGVAHYGNYRKRGRQGEDLREPCRSGLLFSPGRDTTLARRLQRAHMGAWRSSRRRRACLQGGCKGGDM